MPKPAPHSDDAAVDLFSAAMKEKLAKKRAEGRGGWGNTESCSVGFLAGLLHGHVQKGDPVDIGNIAMMLWSRGCRGNGSIPPTPAPSPGEVEEAASTLRAGLDSRDDRGFDAVDTILRALSAVLEHVGEANAAAHSAQGALKDIAAQLRAEEAAVVELTRQMDVKQSDLEAARFSCGDYLAELSHIAVIIGFEFGEDGWDPIDVRLAVGDFVASRDAELAKLRRVAEAAREHLTAKAAKGSDRTQERQTLCALDVALKDAGYE